MKKKMEENKNAQKKTFSYLLKRKEKAMAINPIGEITAAAAPEDSKPRRNKNNESEEKNKNNETINFS